MKPTAPGLPPAVLSGYDLIFVAGLARDLQAVSEVLDDLVYSQLPYGEPGERKYEALLHALTEFIGKASSRLVKELAKAEPRKRRAAAPPTVAA